MGHPNSRRGYSGTYHAVVNLLDEVVAEVNAGHMIPAPDQLSAILSLPPWHVL